MVTPELASVVYNSTPFEKGESIFDIPAPVAQPALPTRSRMAEAPFHIHVEEQPGVFTYTPNGGCKHEVEFPHTAIPGLIEIAGFIFVHYFSRH